MNWINNDLEREYADDLTEKLHRMGNAMSAARKNGKCAHGWRQGKPGPGLPRDTDPVKCLHCGKVATWGELDEDAREIYATYG